MVSMRIVETGFRRPGLLALLLLTTLSFAGTASATPDGADTSSAPWIASDKPDYAPGERVTLEGGNWAPGEPVRLVVDDQAGRTWQRDVTVSAGTDGTISDSFVLPDWFVAVYTVEATSPSGSASWTFTDANLRFLTNGPTLAGTTWTKHSNSSCTAPLAGPGSSGSGTITSTDGATLNVDAANNQWVRITAPATAGGLAFSAWQVTSGGGSFTTSDAGRTICAAGDNSSGLRRFGAVYVAGNSAPAIGAGAASVTVEEGSSASNTGTWSDADAGDTVELTASLGSVERSGTNAAGTWAWSYTPGDGPAAHSVTITADDGNGGTASTSFSLSVTNAAPSAAFEAPGAVDEGDTIPLALTGASDPSAADTAAGFEYAFDCGSGYGDWDTASTASCPTDDDGARTVKGRIRDKDGGSSEYTATIAITNVAPSAELGNDGPVGEGSPATVAFTGQNDPSSADTAAGFRYDFRCDGTPFDATPDYASAGADASAQCTFDDGPTTHTVRARIVDKDGGATTYTTEVEVENIAPSVTLDEGNAYELEESTTAARTFGFSVSDPGDDELELQVECGAGAYVAGSLGAGSFACIFDDDAETEISVTATDDDGAIGSASHAVSVANVAPEVTAPAGQSADEGETKAFSLGSFADPGADSPWEVVVDWGDGSALEYLPGVTAPASLGTVEHAFADDGEYTASVTVVDKDGAAGTAEFTVAVANVAPAVTPPADQSADEGESKAFSLGSFADPGPDGPWSASVDWGDGSTPTTFAAPSTGSLGTQAHTYADDGSYTVTVTVAEAGGSGTPSGQASFAVTVANLPPRVDLVGPDAVDEGDTRLYSFTVSDPGTNDTWDLLAGYPRCGLHGELVTGSVETTAAAGSFRCFFPDGGPESDPTVTQVAVRVVDSDGAESLPAVDRVDVIDVSVANVAPTVTPAAGQAANEGDTALFALGSFTDPALDGPWGVSVDWGDGSPKTTFTEGAAGAIAAKPHAYGDDGTYTVTLKVTDEDGGRGSATFPITVANVAPVASAPAFAFDPLTGEAAASFLYADAGWLDTHAGSTFRWSIDPEGVFRSATLSQVEHEPPDAIGKASDARTLPGGCHLLTVTGVARDDEGGESALLTIAENEQASVHAKGFRPPIMDNERNLAKYGNVVPVKVRIVDACTGAPVTGPELHITLHQGTGSEVIESTNVVAESVSGADTGTRMRIADGMYVYNLSTKTLSAGKDYTLRIRPGSTASPWILQAVLQPKR